MKVTDEMRMLAMAAYGLSRYDYSPDEWSQLCEDWHRALEAALADVPESGGVALYSWYAQKDRAEAAEAKLAKVREWALTADWHATSRDTEHLIAILDDEP